MKSADQIYRIIRQVAAGTELAFSSKINQFITCVCLIEVTAHTDCPSDGVMQVLRASDDS